MKFEVYKQSILLFFLFALSVGVNAQTTETDSLAVGRQYRYEISSWRLGLKTNLLADAVLPANLGIEFELSDHLSLDVNGGFSQTNVISPCKDTRVYGVTPELRYWPKSAMRKGHFFGLHSNIAWFTLKGSDGLLYQNISNREPAWCVGLTYGYLIGLGKNDRWGLELFLGAGYGHYVQKVGKLSPLDNQWYRTEVQEKRHLGLTRAGVNLVYRFDMKKVNVFDCN